MPRPSVSPPGVRISAIIPAWCEQQRLPGVIRALRGQVHEVVVADAGSPDGTAAVAKAEAASLVQADKGRAKQLNQGARVATNEVLVFVHADTRIPDGFGQAIERALQDPAVIGGNFRLHFEGGPIARRVFAGLYVILRRGLRIYYGDSCIFVRREVFEELGGFPDMPIMEDYAFVRRLERRGTTAYIKDPIVITSARRYQGRALRTFWLWFGIQVGFWLRIPPSWLARRYADFR